MFNQTRRLRRPEPGAFGPPGTIPLHPQPAGRNSDFKLTARSKSKSPYVGAKAGNLPGDLTFSWYAVDHTGQPWVVSFQLNWPPYHGSSAVGWLLSIVKQVFAMLPQSLRKPIVASRRGHGSA